MRRLLENASLDIEDRSTIAAVFDANVDEQVENGIEFLPLERLLSLDAYWPTLLRGLLLSMGKSRASAHLEPHVAAFSGSLLPWTAEHAQGSLKRHVEMINEDKQVCWGFICSPSCARAHNRCCWSPILTACGRL